MIESNHIKLNIFFCWMGVQGFRIVIDQIEH